MGTCDLFRNRFVLKVCEQCLKALSKTKVVVTANRGVHPFRIFGYRSRQTKIHHKLRKSDLPCLAIAAAASCIWSYDTCSRTLLAGCCIPLSWALT